MGRSTVVLALVGALVVAACGDDAETSGTSTSAESTVTSAETTGPPIFGEPWAPDRRLEYQPGVYVSLYGPEDCEDGPRPVMVTLNAWLADGFATRGYLGVVVEARIPSYRSRFDTAMLQAIGWAVHDMGIAVQWLRAHAGEQCVAPDAIAAGGGSFGAISALALAYSDDELPAESITIDDYGATVAVEPVDHGPVPADLASSSNDLDGVVSFAGFALPDHLDAGEPPAIMFHGRDDPLVPFSLAEATCEAAHAVGVMCELVAHDVGHSAAPDREAALDRAVAFLDREMLSPAGIALPG